MQITTPTTSTHPSPPPPDNVASPLSPQHLQAFTEANQRIRTIRKAGKIAAFNGWSAGVFAALSLPFALFSVTALVMAVGLALVAWNEFRGLKLLRQFDLRGPTVLGWNQLGFMGLLIGYCLWSIYIGLTGPNPYDEYLQANPELQSMLGSIGNLHTTITVAVYGSVIAASVIFQGLNAWYYFARTKHIKAYLDHTEDWIVEIQRRQTAA